MHQQYYDTNTNTVNTWQQQAAPSEKYPYGLGLDNEEYLRTLGVYPLIEVKAEYNSVTEELVADDTPVVNELGAVLYYKAVPLSADIVTKSYADAIRSERDHRIVATDYLLAADYPITEADAHKVSLYRQALRNIPEQAGFPWQGPDSEGCVWPVCEYKKGTVTNGN